METEATKRKQAIWAGCVLEMQRANERKAGKPSLRGSISFDELDPKASAALEKFRVMSLMHHESMEHMWKAGLGGERSLGGSSSFRLEPPLCLLDKCDRTDRRNCV